MAGQWGHMLRIFVMGHYQQGRSLCHSRAWLPREESRIPGFLARQANETRGNDKKEEHKLTLHEFFVPLTNLVPWPSLDSSDNSPF